MTTIVRTKSEMKAQLRKERKEIRTSIVELLRRIKEEVDDQIATADLDGFIDECDANEQLRDTEEMLIAALCGLEADET